MSTTFHGTQAKVAAKTDNTVAYTDADQVETFSLDQEREILELYELGAAAAQELKEGKISISGSFGRKWEAASFSAMGATLQSIVQNATEAFVALFPEGDASPKILVSNCKFSRWHIETSIDGMLMEAVDYKGLLIGIT